MKNIILALISVALLSSCSVMMAARQEGVSIEKLQSSRTRAQFYAAGVHVISSEKTEEGGLVETYQILKERGSAARALMHGALDFSTCCLWEVVGTPIESCLERPEYFVVRVFYDQNEFVQQIVLL